MKLLLKTKAVGLITTKHRTLIGRRLFACHCDRRTDGGKPVVKYREVNGQIEQYAEAAPVPSVPEPTTEEQEMQVRAARNSLLTLCDWTQLPDAPLTDGEKQEWAEYRQALRDVPEQTGFPENVIWPSTPSAEASNASV